MGNCGVNYRKRRKSTLILKKISIITVVAIAVILIIYGGFHSKTTAYEVDRRNRFGLDADMFALWLKADSVYNKPQVLHMSDSLFHIAVERKHYPAACLALEMKADYYNSQTYVDIDKLTEAVNNEIKYARQQPETYVFVFRAWNKLIKRHIRNKDFGSTLASIDSLQHVSQLLHNDYGYTQSYLLYAQAFADMRNFDNAIDSLKKGINYAKKHSIDTDIYELYSYMARYLTKNGENDLAMKYINLTYQADSVPPSDMLRVIFVHATILHKENMPEQIPQLIEKYETYLAKQQYSHAYFKNFIHAMRAYYYADYDNFKQALIEADSIRISDTQFQTKLDVYETCGRWREGYIFWKRYDNQKRQKNEYDMHQYTAQQDSILRNSNAAINRQKLELQTTQMKLKQMQLQKMNTEMQLRRARNEQELHEQEEKQQLLQQNNEQLRMREQQAEYQQAKAQQDEAETTMQNIMLRQQQRQTIVVTAFIILMLITVTVIIYSYYRRLYIRALESERNTANRTNQEKTTIIQNIRHEIRTPLNTIMGFTDLISMEGEIELTPQEKQEYIGYIRDNTQFLQSTIDNVIHLSELQAGTYKVDVSQVDIAELSDMVCLNAQADVKEGVELVNHCHQCQTIINTGKEPLQQILANLLSNAAKYTEHGTITLDCEEQAELLQFSVTDTGRGIPKDKAEKVFQRFEKLGSQVKGTGLGLHISRSLTQLLGGTIYVDTDYTGGCRMVVTIPKQYSNIKKKK